MNFNRQQECYIKARSIEGRVLSDEQVKYLPNADIHVKEWKMRKHALSVLTNYLVDTIAPNSSILDLGCGNGWMSNQISALGFDLTGMDVNGVEIEQAKRVFPEVNFHLENIMNVKNKKFDLVVIAGAFQYFENTEALFLKLKSILNDNGKLIIMETFFYYDEEIQKAKAASDSYYKKIGVVEMKDFYFHQNWNCLSLKKYRVIYKLNVIFKLLNKMGGTYSPFPIIEVSL